MPTIDWPDALVPQTAQLSLRKAGVQFASPFNGTLQSLDFIAERWTLSCSLAQMSARNPRGVEAFCNRLAGGIERVRVWPFHTRGSPRGTLRGSPTLGSSVARGATALPLVGGVLGNNLLVYPQRLDLAPWSGAVVTTANTHAAPDTSVTADTIADDSTTVTEDRVQVVAVPANSQTYTTSLWVRKTTGGTSKTFSVYTFLSGGTSVGNTVRINTDSGAVLAGTATVTSDGDYWRVAASAANNGTNTSLAIGLQPAFAAHGSATNDVTQTGSAVVWEVTCEAGATASPYRGQPTLLAGDFIGCGGQLFMVASDLVLSDGVGSVLVLNRVRATIASGSLVTLLRPSCEMVLPAMQSGPVRRSGVIESTALDLVEIW
jgi:hypothetical protein